jgi:hypothetical protein
MLQLSEHALRKVPELRVRVFRPFSRNNPALNTEVSVLNKVNATGVLGLQTSQDTNKLLIAILEQQTIRAKQLRDAQAQAIDQDVYSRAQAVSLNQQLTGGIESALANFRIP